MPNELIKQELLSAFEHLVKAKRNDNTKGRLVEDWFRNRLNAIGKASLITESKQIGNRIAEQFRHQAHHIIFVYNKDVAIDTLVRKIEESWYSELQSVLLVKHDSGNFLSTNLLVSSSSPVSDFYIAIFKGINVQQIIQASEIEYGWYVGASIRDEDKTNEFITSGSWENGYDDKYIETVKSVKVGDCIAIKSMFTRKRDIPFNNMGKTVSCMNIKAIGIVTRNPGDGKRLYVDWSLCDPYKVWYMYTGAVRDTISVVRATTSQKHKNMLEFTFSNKAQDYDECDATIADMTSPVTEVKTAEIVEVTPEPDEVEYTEYFPVPMEPEQVIFFGAPGTGKSYDINEKIKSKYTDLEMRASHSKRVTFYPDYEYSDFIGSLRPVRHPVKGLDYEFIPGPLTQILVECFKKPSEMFYLIIEEINRGNAPAIFGDLFQLLDRGESGKSVYEINNDEIASYIKKETRYLNIFNDKKIWFPSNLSLFCSMNTADQNVFVLDTAFSRRFERSYIRIDFNKLTTIDKERKLKYTSEGGIFEGSQSLADVFENTELSTFVSELNSKGQLQRNWPTFALLVNRIIDIVNDRDGMEQISEDKKLGPFFVSEADLSSRKSFVNKVIFYLKQDVFRYVEQYFVMPYQSIYELYAIKENDLFSLLKVGD